jgi:hypothetical protein
MQVAVYITVDSRAQATLEAVSLAVNGQLVRQQHYSAQQLEALRRAGGDRLYVGALAHGSNTLLITFAGLTQKGKPYAQSASLDVDADAEGRYVEFQLARTSTKGVPDIVAAASPPGETARE